MIWHRIARLLTSWTARLSVRLWRSFSVTGLLVGTLFFAASLTPSLIPRTWLTQGVLSGMTLAAGYGVGTFGHWLWSYLGLPDPGPRTGRIVKLVAATVCAAIAVAFLWQASGWQNSIGLRMEMEPVDRAQPFRVGGIALAVFGALTVVARMFSLTLLLVSRSLRRHVPHRVSNVLGAVAAVALFWALVDGVLLEVGLRAADGSFRQVDALMEEGLDKPTFPLKTGSPTSLVAWEDLGRLGRRYVLSGPTGEQMSRFFGEGTPEPIRVYVGLNSAGTPEERAKLAVEELRRLGGFDREVLVVITPPGTGWIDGAAIDTVEYLHRGDIASVAVQYSYLPSWLSLMVRPAYGVETARALFDEVYGYWTQLPEDDRPRLYLHGVSLGAMNSDLSTDLFDVIGDPFQGALWSGPPFTSKTWQTATRNRRPGTPAWLPRFRDDRIIRFTNQWNALALPNAEWGPVRIVYLQYGSDPVTFFDPRAVYRRPDWMAQPRAPDVSPQFRWIPIVTALQLAVDVAAATTSPVGYGHVYAAEDYIDAWIEVTQPEGWSKREIERLKDLFRARARPERKTAARQGSGPVPP